MRILIRGGRKKLTLHAILLKMRCVISRMLRAFCSFAYLDTRQSQKTHTARNLFKIYLYHITHIDCPAKGLSIGIHCAPRGTATARNLIQNEWYHITNVASLLLLCVSRYAAVAKNSHCTQSYSKYVVSYHAHCEPFAHLRISIRGGRKKLTLHAIYSKYICIISRTLTAPRRA